ncbi:MAG: hypothetical protein VYB47_00975 [Candidatus Thermoplasmatota archaeon]|nr:hypothetical protein [Candidatus Thermoplasmatota archaeon]
MSEIDWNAALERLESLFETSKSNNEGTDIPEVVKAVLGDEADGEFIDLVMMAMEDSGKITTAEILDGIMKLHEWRLSQL